MIGAGGWFTEIVVGIVYVRWGLWLLSENYRTWSWHIRCWSVPWL